MKILNRLLILSVSSCMLFSNVNIKAYGNRIEKSYNKVSGDIMLDNGTMLYEDYITNNDNFSKRKNEQKYIVIHDTANESPSAGADAHRRYFQNNEDNVSIHYVVDKNKAIHVLQDNYSAYHVGDRGNSSGDKTNYTTIGIELCVNDSESSDEWNKVKENGVFLVRELMSKYDIPKERVIMHKDASGKQCSSRLSKNENEGWNEFKSNLDTEYGKVSNINTNLNMRDLPSIEGKIVEQLPSSEIVEILYKDQLGWYKVEISNGSVGYVSGQYIEKVK